VFSSGKFETAAHSAESRLSRDTPSRSPAPYDVTCIRSATAEPRFL
jgi:hypothetical protein